MHARPYTQSNACAVVHFDARLLAVSVSKCASYTVMNHICRIMQMPQHVETLQATSASKRVRKSPFIYLYITHSTICYHILLHVLFPFLFWMRVWLCVRGWGGGEVGTMEERNKLQWQHLLQHRVSVSVFQMFYHFTLKLVKIFNTRTIYFYVATIKYRWRKTPSNYSTKLACQKKSIYLPNNP